MQLSKLGWIAMRFHWPLSLRKEIDVGNGKFCGPEKDSSMSTNKKRCRRHSDVFEEIQIESMRIEARGKRLEARARSRARAIRKIPGWIGHSCPNDGPGGPYHPPALEAPIFILLRERQSLMRDS